MSLVSVIIPTYNRAKNIHNTINSVLSQTYSNIEVIIVDDNSTDNTQDIIQNYMGMDSRIKYLRNNVNLGAPASRNAGIQYSTGKFISLLDDDDLWYPNKIEKQIELFKNPKVGLVYSGYEVITSDGDVIKTVFPKEKGNVLLPMLKNNFIGSPTNLILKECFDSVGYCDENLQSCQDWDLWIRISKIYHVDYIPEVLAKYKLSTSSTFKNPMKASMGYTALLSKYNAVYQANKNFYSSHLETLGVYQMKCSNYNNALDSFAFAIKMNPLNYKAYLWYIYLKIIK